MIDEDRQGLAAEYALNALSASAAREFEAELARDPELRAFTDELCEATAALAQAAPQQSPPPELRERVLSTIRAEAAAVSEASPATATKSSGFSLLPWVLAAGFALTTAAVWFERDQLREESRGMIKEAMDLRRREEISKEKIARLAMEAETLRQENKTLQDRDALAQVRIATLTAQRDDAYAKGSAIILWDAAGQRGIVRLRNLPQPGTGKDYQLWVVDPKYPQPVSGGTIHMEQDGSARVSFTTDQPIEKADKFAISVEPAGGVPKATGPIVLLGE
jgi:anti-sigma-K factor RskA